MQSISWKEGRACGGDNAEISGDLVSWCLAGRDLGLRLAFGMVLRIVISEHWGQWTGRETEEREYRACWDRIKVRLLPRSLSKAMALTIATVFSRSVVISITEPYEA